jgi:DNA-binding NarL/FixJ family response regulator
MRSVLVVEDELDARTMLARSLERARFSVSTAASMQEVRAAIAARAATEQAPFEAMVVDVVLGAHDRGGLELLPELRAHNPRGAVVVVTAFADLERVKSALNAGASYLLEKPFRAAELIALLTRLIEEATDLGWLVDRALRSAALTDKEREIALLVLKGLPSNEIARLMGNSDKTIRQHLSQIYSKCGVDSRAAFFHYVFPT